MQSKRESGSTALTIMISVMSVGMSFAYVQQTSQKAKNQIDQVRTDAEGISREIADTSSLARFRALLANKKLPDGTYEPGIYPSNYFDASWSLLKNDNVLKLALAGTIPTTSSGSILMKVTSSKKLSTDVLESQVAPGALEDKTIFVRRVNFDEPGSTLVKSLEVEVQSEGEKKIRARIPMQPPVGGNPILEIRPLGGAWTRNFTNLLSGDYEVRVLASGVVLEAEVEINGTVVAKVGGFNLEGKVTHEAVNPLAKDKEIGRFTYNFAGGASDYEFDVVRCEARPIDGVFNYRILLKGADGVVTPTAPSTPIKLGSGGTGALAQLSEDDFKNACPAQCPFIEETPSYSIDRYRESQVESEQFTDFSWGHHLRVTREQFKAPYKYCESIKTVFDEVMAETNGEKAGQTTVQIMTKMFKKGDVGWAHLDYVAYKEPACERKFLFQRNACGCFADNTKIRMEDGSEKAITELTQSDRVWNPVTKKGQAIRRMTKGPEKVPMFQILSAGKEVVVTGTHPFETRQGLLSAFHLQEGQEIRGADGSWVRIDTIGIKPMDGKAPVVWNLELEGSYEDDNQHFVEANGIVTGDLFLQTKLQNKASVSSN